MARCAGGGSWPLRSERAKKNLVGEESWTRGAARHTFCGDTEIIKLKYSSRSFRSLSQRRQHGASKVQTRQVEATCPSPHTAARLAAQHCSRALTTPRKRADVGQRAFLSEARGALREGALGGCTAPGRRCICRRAACRRCRCVRRRHPDEHAATTRGPVTAGGSTLDGLVRADSPASYSL